MTVAFPLLVTAIGVAVLLFGKRLAVLGAAVGALLALGLMRLFSISADPLFTLLFVAAFAVVGFFVAGFAKGIVNLVILVLGALGGAAIALGFLNLFTASAGALGWIFALVGGVVGLILVQRFKDWAMLLLAGLIGGLLVTRGLAAWLPILEGALGTLVVIVLAGASIVFQGGLLNRGKAAA
jgi:hypothetical protein